MDCAGMSCPKAAEAQSSNRVERTIPSFDDREIFYAKQPAGKVNSGSGTTGSTDSAVPAKNLLGLSPRDPGFNPRLRRRASVATPARAHRRSGLLRPP